MKKQARIILVEDHPIVCQCLRALLDRNPGITVIAETGTGKAAIALVRKLEPELVIMDIMLPKINWIEVTRQILQSHPLTKIIALSSYSQPVFVNTMLQAGACGYVLKDSLYAELLLAIKKVKRDDIYISKSLTRESSCPSYSN